MPRISIILFLIFLLPVVSLSQQPTYPDSFSMKSGKEVPVVQIKNQIGVLKPKSKDEPLQAGITIPVNIDNKDGLIEKSSSGYIWRISLEVIGAKALNIYARELNLSDGDRLYLYNPKDSNLIRYNNSKHNLISDFVKGNTLIIEVNSPKPILKLPIKLEEIGMLFLDGRGYGDAGVCEVHINCVEGESWQNEKNGVARILVKEGNSTFWCTGSLVNNTLNNRKPYFLTANHCGMNADSADYSEWMFYFNYEARGCGAPSVEPEYNLITGSRLLARSHNSTSNGSDFKLLLLDEEVSPLFTPYYNGWDRRGISSPEGVTIHHPQGDIKMISTYKTPLISTRYDSETEDPTGFFWKVEWAATTNGHGVTEGGSSGSPIFSSEGLILGSLTGGRASCSYPNQPDFYGKLSYSWNGDMSDSTTNLSYWLDPIGSGVSFLKGTNFDSTSVFAGFSAEKTTIVVGESISFINTSYGNISSYQWFFEGADPDFSEDMEPTGIEYSSTGEFDVKLVVSSAEGADTLLVKDYITVLPNISPNPGNGVFVLSFGGEIPKDLSIRVFNSSGGENRYYIEDQTEDQITLRILPVSDGIYFIQMKSSSISNTYKVIVTGT